MLSRRARGLLITPALVPFTFADLSRDSLLDVAAHRPGKYCEQEVRQTIGSSLIPRAVEIDLAQSERRDAPTKSENSAEVSDQQIDEATEAPYADPIPIDEYLAEHTFPVENSALPLSGIEIDVYSDVAGWDLDELDADRVGLGVFNSAVPSNPLQSAVFDCFGRKIYIDDVMDGREVDLFVLGRGDLCISRETIALRSLGICTAAGRTRNNGRQIIITPRAGQRGVSVEASYIFGHEFYGHGFNEMMSGQADTAKKREYVAYDAGSRAFREMVSLNSWILELDETGPVKND